MNRTRHTGTGVRQLTDRLKRQAIQLDGKKLELQVEKSLEKVRSIAMRMMEPADMLKICKMITQQLQKLGVREIRNVQTAIFYRSNGVYLNYEFFRRSGKSLVTEVEYNKQKDVKAFVNKMLSGPKAFFRKDFNGKAAVKNWVDYQKNAKQYVDPFTLKAKSVHYYFYSIGQGALGISTYAPLSIEQVRLLKRFRNVFQLAYQRFMDIQRARAHEKEAQIELGLERVRARAMAMKSSDELAELVGTVFRELTRLGFKLTSSIIWINDHSTSSNTLWIASAEMNKPAQPYLIKPFHKEFFNSIIHAWKARDPKWVYSLTGKEKKKFEKAFFTELPGLPAALKKALVEPNQVVFSASFNNFGALEIVETEALTAEKFNILHRFGKVFNLSYTRFNDLKKSEAQAREAQIEVAVERVRGKALAMHRSEELHEVVVTLKKELARLEIPNVAAATIYLEQEDGSIRVLDLSTGDFNQSEYQMKLDKVFRLDETHPGLWIRKIWQGTEKYFVIKVVEKDFDRMVDWLCTIDAAQAKLAENIIKKNQIKQAWLPTVRLEKGRMNIDLLAPPTPEIETILTKMGAGFDLAYRRFLDLLKAEEQARQAQIELALERVRARTMAMHKSEELVDASAVLFHELQQLGFKIRRSGFGIYNEKEQGIQLWLTGTNRQAKEKAVLGFIPFTAHPAIMENYLAWKKKDPMRVHEFADRNQVRNYYRKIGKHITIPPQNTYPSRLVFTVFFFSEGSLNVMSDETLTDDECGIMLRFANVFDQTYRRYLDLQRAEAQAREAQIEAALERVRSRSMAMHNTDELLEAAQLIHKELSALGFNSMNVSYAFVDEDEKKGSYYSIDPVDGKILPIPFVFPHHETKVMRSILSSWKKQEPFNVIELDLKETLKHQTYIGRQIQEQLAKNNIPFSIESFLKVSPKEAVLSTFNFKKGYLFNIGGARLTKGQEELMLRFTKVFEQTYTRFLDLQKAEEQAREGQIELGLERVRAKAMAMQNSNELKELIGTVFTELTKLDLVLTRCVIMIYNDKTDDSRWWMANSEDPNNPAGFFVKHHHHPPIAAYFKAWREKQLRWTYVLEGQVKNDWDVFLFNETELKSLPDFVIEGMKAPDKVYLNASFNNFGNLTLASLKPLSEEHFDILLRFAKVFDLTYTRFNDLQKAEYQAREAQIEAALERVRSTTMAMHKSEDSLQVIKTLGEQLVGLGIEIDIVNFNSDYRSRDWNIWLWTITTVYPTQIRIPYIDHPYFKNVKWAIENGQDAVCFVYNKEEKDSFQEHFYRSVKSMATPERIMMLKNAPGFSSCVVFSKNTSITIGKYSTKAYTEEQTAILKRFATAFEQAYTRFMDLQKAEGQAREAQIEAALERVRSKAMAMHKTDDIHPAVAVVFEEMEKLNLGTLRCGIGILSREKMVGDVWTTHQSAEGSKVQISGNESLDIHPLLEGAYKAWLNQQDFSYILEGDDQVNYYRALTKTNFHLPESELIMNASEETRQFYYVTPFEAGTLFGFRQSEFTAEAKEVMKRFANVFNLTYKRFQDLQKAEALAQQAELDLIKLKDEKKRTEEALLELRATQTQLIQSEKMASLGELTAGIAHEIQNPLNFVNNFSDVSNELLDEMKAELEKGNSQDAMAMVGDIKQNLQKILHHGKRADAIVKGMLQHSRSSTGQKEAIDINTLAEEYLRLAYHGLRAKDKTFNARFEFACDSTIGKISVIPQDMGRVILNLINNAFYAVSEKRKQNLPGYEPTVSVQTSRSNGKIQIKVKDNGNGIPRKVLDKIFQPFFTTKPTGQGTGLGLSLSYDIVTKGHGGELKVETEEGAGSVFTVILP